MKIAVLGYAGSGKNNDKWTIHNQKKLIDFVEG